MTRMPKLILAGLALALAGCSSLGGAGEGLGSPYYSLVRVRSVQVGDGSLAVTAPRPWNKTRTLFLFDDVRWSRTGPSTDR